MLAVIRARLALPARIGGSWGRLGGAGNAQRGRTSDRK